MICLLVPGAPGDPGKVIRGRVTNTSLKISNKGSTVSVSLQAFTGTGAYGQARPAKLGEIGGEDYFADEYIEKDTPWQTAGNEIEWTLTAGELDIPVDPRRLSDPMYSLLDINASGSAGEQAAQIAAAASAAVSNPTGNLPGPRIAPQMRSLVSERLLKRDYWAMGTLLVSPRDINLATAGAEP